jgi:hypothetical protein
MVIANLSAPVDSALYIFKILSYVKRFIERMTIPFIVPYIVVNARLISGKKLTPPGQRNFIEICSAVSETCTT